MSKFKPCDLRGYNNYDVKFASDEAMLVNTEPSMTQQHFKDDCDINVIVERFGLTGELPTNVRAPMYGDFTGVTDYRSALDQVMAAEDSFMQMPPAVRLKFDNDPQKFVDFCSDPGNIEAMREMGLAVARSGENGKGAGGVDGGVGSSGGGKIVASVGGSRGDEASAGGGDGGVGSGAAGRFASGRG